MNTLRALCCCLLWGLGLTMGAHAQGTPTSVQLTLGEAQLLPIDPAVARLAMGDPSVADYIRLGPQELYLLGKRAGVTNLLMWTPQGALRPLRLEVGLNLKPIQALLQNVFPDEREIQILASGDSLILRGAVSDALTADAVWRLVRSQFHQGPPYNAPKDMNAISNVVGKTDAGNAGSDARAPGVPPDTFLSQVRLVNLLQVRAPQQVMLEVRVAEVSKSYLESLGVEWGISGGNRDAALMTGFVTNATLSLLFGRGSAQKVNPNGSPLYSNKTEALKAEAQRKDGVVKILAEPTIVAMSGHEGRFLVGGKIFIPVNQALGSTTYEERTYGVGLRFVPTVLASGRINLQVAPEVSEPVKESVTAGTNSSLPAFKSSYVATTVQMAEGENLVIGGLLRDNINEIVKAIPLLGELPVLGALFRSTQFITERTELLIVVKPSLIRGQSSAPRLPTDDFVPPTRRELFIDGQLQGKDKPAGVSP
jgi:pilus assembly protein CpaC